MRRSFHEGWVVIDDLELPPLQSCCFHLLAYPLCYYKTFVLLVQVYQIHVSIWGRVLISVVHTGWTQKPFRKWKVTTDFSWKNQKISKPVKLPTSNLQVLAPVGELGDLEEWLSCLFTVLDVLWMGFQVSSPEQPGNLLSRLCPGIGPQPLHQSLLCFTCCPHLRRSSAQRWVFFHTSLHFLSSLYKKKKLIKMITFKNIISHTNWTTGNGQWLSCGFHRLVKFLSLEKVHLHCDFFSPSDQ